MNWREKHYPATVTMRRWLRIAAAMVITLMVLWIGFAISSANNKGQQPRDEENQAISHMATDRDVARILPSDSVSTEVTNKKVAEKSIKKITPGNNALGSVSVVSPNDKLNTNLISSSTGSFKKGAKIQISEDELKAMQTPISQNQITDSTESHASSLSEARASPSSTLVDKNDKNISDDQNKQAEKKAFLEESQQNNLNRYLGSALQNPLSKLEIQSGTIIPGVLITGIDSDLPGQITGQVRENVYDSLTGRYLLIPQGSKLIGLYDSQVAYGQTRVLIAWNRIILPNGKSIDLKGMSGTDVSGYAGFEDQTDNHYGKIFGSVMLLSVLSAGAQLSQPQNQNSSMFSANNPSINQTIAQSLGANITNAGTAMLQKNINIQPTLAIRPGYKFNITATKDVVFFESYQEN